MNLNENTDTEAGEGAGQTLEFPGLSSIAAEELSEAEAGEAAALKAAEKEAANVEGDLADEYLEAVNHAADLICAPFPSAEPVWSKERKVRLAAALARCDSAYGWGGIGGFMSHPLIGLAFAGVPLAVGTARAIAKDRAEMAAATGKPEGALAPSFSAGDPLAAAAGAPPNYGNGQVVTPRPAVAS